MGTTGYAGHVKSVAPNSLAAAMGLQPGDELLRVNGHTLRDVIDVQYYAAEDQVRLEWRRGGRIHRRRGARASNMPLGLEFMHPTFDIDIRRCNNLCPFCFVLQTPKGVRRTLYIKDDDYRYSFLYGHFVTLTNLADEDWARIEEQHLSPLYVSVHATDPALRQVLLRNSRAEDILEQLRWLTARGIEVHTQLVVVPGLNDGEALRRSIADLAALYPGVASVSVVPVGITKFHKYGHRPNTRAEADVVVDLVEGMQRGCRRALGVRFAYLTDEWYLLTERPIPPRAAYDGLHLEENGLGMVRGFLDDWKKVRRETARRRERGELAAAGGWRVTLVTAALFAPALAGVAAEFAREAGVAVEVVPVLNERLGHTITVSGLLMARDVIAQLRGRAGDVAVLPRIMFDHPQGISLDDLAPIDVARELGRPVALADAMGDVLDVLRGRNALTFDPAAPESAVPVVREGGWAVEKYLAVE